MINTTKTVSQLLDEASKAGSSRTFGGQGAAVNTVMGLTIGQRESLFAWLLQNKAAALGKVTKDTMSEISDIPNIGCVIAKDRSGNMAARGGGTLTLGFIKQTGTIVIINHFSRHNWDGSFILATSRSLDASATGQLTR